MLIPHKGHTDTIQVYSVTVMTNVKALQAGHSSQGTSEPITPERLFLYMVGHSLVDLVEVNCLRVLVILAMISRSEHLFYFQFKNYFF